MASMLGGDFLVKALTRNFPFGLKTLVLRVQNIEDLVPPFFWRLRLVAQKPPYALMKAILRPISSAMPSSLNKLSLMV
jgi:hypothetical protein